MAVTVRAKVGGKDMESPIKLRIGDEVELTALDQAKPSQLATGVWSQNGIPVTPSGNPMKVTMMADGSATGTYTFKEARGCRGRLLGRRVSQASGGTDSDPIKVERTILIEAKITNQNGTSAADSPLRLNLGDIATLTLIGANGPAAPVGVWQKDNVTIEGTSNQPTLNVTSSKNKPGRGVYTFKPNVGALSNKIAVEADDRSRATKIIATGAPALILLVLYVLGAIYVLTGSIADIVEWKRWDGSSRSVERSYIFAFVSLAMVLLVIYLAGRATNGSGVRALVIGQDQRASTSKFQLAMWTFFVGFALAYIAGYSAITGKEFECGEINSSNCVPPENWPTYLLLLGAPAIAATLAKGVTSYRVDNGMVQKSTADSTSIADLTNNDAGDPDLIDTQYLLFNVIAFGYVAAIFFQDHTLPSVPNILLGLTSAAAGTYVLNKSLQINRPLITSVMPSVVSPGVNVTVRGQNLLVAGSDGVAPAVLNAKVGGVATSAVPHPTEREALSLVAPPGMNKSDSTIKVITGANVESDGFPIEIVPLKVVGWLGTTTPPMSGMNGTKLQVSGLPPASTAAGESVTVVIGGLSLGGKIEPDGVVSFNLPKVTATTPMNDVDVKVGVRGQISEPTMLPLDPEDARGHKG